MRVIFSYLVQKDESVFVYTKEVYHNGVGWIISVEVNNTWYSKVKVKICLYYTLLQTDQYDIKSPERDPRPH